MKTNASKRPLRLLILCLLLTCVADTRADSPPNIVFIMADDLGYGDVGCYGATLVKTPNIDGLANSGIRFTDAHTPASSCTPTRYGLLTGNYPKTGVVPPHSPLIVPTNQMTLASMLKKAGYRTGCIGKWHLGFGGKGGPDWNGEIKPGPLEVGFDYYFGVPVSNNWAPFVYVENRHVYGRKAHEVIKVAKRGPRGYERELSSIANKRKHEEIAVVQTARAVKFIESNDGKPFFLYFAPCNVHHPHTPGRKHVGKSKAGIYGDFVEELDWSLGQVLDALGKLKILDNTIVVFTSDNGPEMRDQWYYKGPRVTKHASNGILRGQKGSEYEGGHRVPFIANWPGKIKASTTSDALICLTDMLATFAAVVDVQLPKSTGKDSFNILPELLAAHNGPPIRQSLKHFRGAFRMNEWKLYRKELYNLRTDVRERNNVYEQHPEIVKKITALKQQQKQAGRSAPLRKHADSP